MLGFPMSSWGRALQEQKISKEGICSDRNVHYKRQRLRCKDYRYNSSVSNLFISTDFARGRFILEYLGEVMSTTTFSKRVKQYEKENYEHYYCMALDARSMIDATKKGGIARFLNHSCNPNCEMEKWTVGKRYRMGIFAKRTIQKGEELTFDYKFVRYNAEPQKCLCLEPNCKGTIGITKNIAAVPGEEDDFDDLDEDLEDVSSDATKKKRGPKALETPEDVKSLVKKMLRTEEKKGQINRIIDILLITESVPCLRRFVQLHGISILKAWLSTFPSDYNIIRRVVQILLKLPINTKNTVDDNKIEPIVRSFDGNQDLLISTLSKKLLENWSKLNLVYRIPKAPKKPQTSKNVGSTEGSSSAANGDNVLRSNSDKRNTLNNIPYKKPFKDYGDRSYAGSRRESVTSGNSISDLNKDKKSEFYKSREAKEALLTDLPNDWDYAFNGQGEAYFFNRHSKGSQWDFPFSDLPQEKRDLLFKKLDALYEKSSLNGILKRKSNEDDRDIKRNKIEVVGSKDSSAASLVVEDQEPKKPSALVEKYTEDDIQKVIEKAKRQKELEEERLRIQQKVLEEEKEQRRLKKLKKLEEEKAKKAAKRAERELKKKEALESSSSTSLSAAKEADPVAVAPEKSTSIESSPEKQLSSDQKSEFREQVSSLVIKYFSRFKNKLSPDDFKKHARKITHLIMKKESKESAGNSAVDEEVIKRKIKKFVVSYGDKLISRPADKID